MAKRRLEEFELGDTLGVGTVGTVYRAVERKSGRAVAVKILLPTVSGDANITTRFEREMLILSKLSHPNVVEYYGGGRHEGQWFYAMELVEGGTLKQVLAENGRLPWQEVLSIGRQVTSALQHLHNHGIVHRDLKPANLYMSGAGEVKLGDFGIARDTTSQEITATGMTVGTYAYMPPEQIAGEPADGGKSDLYALGCLLFEALTGRPPFEGENFASLFQQHLHERPPDVRDLASDTPDDLAALIGRLLEKDPAARPFNARAVQGVILRIAADHRLISEGNHFLAPQREAVGQRVNALRDVPTREVSWLTLSALGFVLAAIVGLAWWLAAR